MAIALVAATGRFDAPTRDTSDAFSVLHRAQFNGGDARDEKMDTALAEVTGRPDFVVEATAAGDDTTLTSVFNLSDAGVTFPAGFKRRVTLKAYAAETATSADAAYQEIVCLVNGGTTPVVEEAFILVDIDGGGLDIAQLASLAEATNEISVQIAGVATVATTHKVEVYLGRLVEVP